MGDGHARWERRDVRAGSRSENLHALSASRWNASGLRPGRGALSALLAFGVSVATFAWAQPAAASMLFHGLLWLVFAVAVGLRLLALALPGAATEAALVADQQLPVYTVIAPLYREAGVVEQLVRALGALDYPRHRLQVVLVLEPDDSETWAAVARLHLPSPFEIFVAPPGWPRTKPRACNEALERARGDFVVIYDAEDRPHPGQLREAVARFAQDPGLSCLQAPLRVDGSRRFLQRQFALEYAAQFEVMLPALHRLGAPFPLGGSSNHFRVGALRSLGGWDAYNVTEDADLGFRLAAAGLRTGLLRCPTQEQAPETLRQWLPQRGRWLKGHLQTWCVHAARPGLGGWRRFAALQATLGLGLVSAFGHGPLLLWLVVNTVGDLTGRTPSGPPLADLTLVGLGWGVAVLVMRRGAARAGLRLRWRDALSAPLYWPLHSIAALRALWQWFTRPFHWDKTEHRPAA